VEPQRGRHLSTRGNHLLADRHSQYLRCVHRDTSLSGRRLAGG
jgi:hypothetical protein